QPAVILPVVAVVQGDGDELLPVARRGTDQASAGQTGISGLDAVGALVTEQHLVFVQEMVVPTAVGIGKGLDLCGGDLPEDRIAHGVGGQLRQIVGGRIVFRLVEPVGVGETGA